MRIQKMSLFLCQGMKVVYNFYLTEGILDSEVALGLTEPKLQGILHAISLCAQSVSAQCVYWLSTMVFCLKTLETWI